MRVRYYEAFLFSFFVSAADCSAMEQKIEQSSRGLSLVNTSSGTPIQGQKYCPARPIAPSFHSDRLIKEISSHDNLPLPQSLSRILGALFNEHLIRKLTLAQTYKLSFEMIFKANQHLSRLSSKLDEHSVYFNQIYLGILAYSNFHEATSQVSRLFEKTPFGDVIPVMVGFASLLSFDINSGTRRVYFNDEAFYEFFITHDLNTPKFL